MSLSIVGPNIPNLPWQPRAADTDLAWRYDRSPVIGRRPLPRVTGMCSRAPRVDPSRAARITPIEVVPSVTWGNGSHAPRSANKQEPATSVRGISRAPGARFLTFLVFP